jgi:uncharacterized membrane protein
MCQKEQGDMSEQTPRQLFECTNIVRPKRPLKDNHSFPKFVRVYIIYTMFVMSRISWSNIATIHPDHGNTQLMARSNNNTTLRRFVCFGFFLVLLLIMLAVGIVGVGAVVVAVLELLLLVFLVSTKPTCR